MVSAGRIGYSSNVDRRSSGRGRLLDSRSMAARERARLKPVARPTARGAPARRFHAALIKPSHYAADGYRRMRKRIQSDPQARGYVDESLRTVAGSNATDEFVQVYADKIPNTYGAPVRRAVAAH